MFARTKTESPFNFEESLSLVLANAEKAGVPKRSIAETLSKHAEDYAKRDVLGLNLSGSPSATYFDGRGKPLPRL